MEKLKQFYRICLRFLTVLIAIFAFFLMRHVAPLIETAAQASGSWPWWFSMLSSSAFITGIFLIVELIIRKFLWKLFHRELNFSGEWEGTTAYTELEIESDSVTKANFEPRKSRHKVIIVQDCTNIAIAPATGAHYTSWQSKAIALTDDGELQYAYSVNYSSNDKLPQSAIGYEEMKVIKRGPRGIPILMSGFFYHCAGGQRPVYRGQTIFKRMNHKNSIAKEDLPVFARDENLKD